MMITKIFKSYKHHPKTTLDRKTIPQASQDHLILLSKVKTWDRPVVRKHPQSKVRYIGWHWMVHIYIYLYICNYVHIYIYWNHHLSSFFQCLLIQLANPIFWFTSYLIYSNIICPCKVRENHVAPPSFLPTPWQHFGTFLRYQKASEACEDRRSLLKETRNVQFKVPPRWVSRAGPWDRGDSWRFQVERDITKKKNGYDGESTKKHNGVNLGEIPEAANSKMACI
jgi:hypothetical protein